MRPKKLTLSAWGPYRDRQEIDFEALGANGIFLITGATGAGKTTIFDAITYALYGALSGEERDRERGSVRSDFSNEQTPTFVELVMEHGGKEYRILRNPEYLRPKKRGGKGAEGGKVSLTKEKENACLYCPDGRILEGSREVNAALLELLVLDYQQFKKISMIAQGEFAKLLVAPPKEKTKIFREIFGTGIYERFTTGLGVRSRKLYAVVMEQRHKLEEDVRLLTTGLEKSVWGEETQKRLSTLLQTEYWNYEKLVDILAEMETEAVGKAAEFKEAYEKCDKSIEKLAAQISGEEEQQRKLLQLEKVTEEKRKLEQQAADMKRQQMRLQNAVNAGFVEGAEAVLEQSRRQFTAAAASLARVREEERALSLEAEDLSEITQRIDRLRNLLELARQQDALKAQKESLEGELAQKEELLREGQKEYLKQEECYLQQKQACESAEQKYRRSAIGIVAAMLKEGSPCPVCGSLNHPSPAGEGEEMMTGEALQEQKQLLQKTQEGLQKLHEKTVAVKTLRDNLSQQLKQTVQETERIEELLSAQSDGVCKRYLELPVEKAAAQINQKWERAGAVSELLLEKKRQEQHFIRQQEECEKQVQDSYAGYEEMLQQYGFSDEEDYQAARLSKDERRRLQLETENYNKSLAASRELYRHLKNTTRRQDEVNIGELRANLEEVRKQKESALKQQKSWEHARTEVKKTKGLMKDKLQSIEKASAEYGYVKDLENMAAGNNSRRLVFEQYVLAAYFEDILRAANERFRKMTSGRYEMSRVGEVGDGRIKDYLEIQVMDYYTGKYRSVRTLSGGESFKASLSLALGMSDVIQAMNGGIRVDTLFVDEGFGALDEESLDQACSTLMSLAQKDCMIGIISHVQELGEKIGNQLIIEKTNSGSFVRSSVK